MRVEKYYIRCNARRCIENTADTWLVLRLPRREISKCSTIGHGSYSIQIGRTVSFPTPTALLLRFLTFSLSPFFLFVRSISFSPSSFLLLPPSDRKQIRDTAAAQQQVVRFACRVFRVTRGNRHGNLIFTEKLIIPAVSCIYTIVDRVSSKTYHRRLGTGGIIAWPPIRERERERRRRRNTRRLWKLCCHCDWRLTKGATHILLLFLRFRERQEISLLLKYDCCSPLCSNRCSFE